MIKVNLNENEQISSQHEDIDSKLFYFLIRRLTVIERKLGDGSHGMEPLKVKEYKFDGFPGYGFNGYMSKKDMEKSIITMLYENDIKDYIYDMDERDPNRVKIVKTVRKFLNFMLSDQK